MNQTGTQPVETERLLLRRFTMEDTEPMYRAWCTDPEVTRYLRFAPHKDVEETRGIVAGWVADYQKSDYYIWAVTLKNTGELIGSIGVVPANEEDALPGYWEPGYCFARPHWNKGYATEHPLYTPNKVHNIS